MEYPSSGLVSSRISYLAKSLCFKFCIPRFALNIDKKDPSMSSFLCVAENAIRNVETDKNGAVKINSFDKQIL